MPKLTTPEERQQLREQKQKKAFKKLQEQCRDKLLEANPIKTYRDVANYLELILHSHRCGEVSKDVAQQAGYVSGVLLQAIRLAKVEEGPTSGLSATLMQRTLTMDMTPDQARAIVMAGSSTLQIQMLKVLEEQGQVVDVTEKKVIEPIGLIEKRIVGIVERAEGFEKDDGFFGEEE